MVMVFGRFPFVSADILSSSVRITDALIPQSSCAITKKVLMQGNVLTKTMYAEEEEEEKEEGGDKEEKSVEDILKQVREIILESNGRE